MKRCPKCDHEVFETDYACMKCGADLVQRQPAPAAGPKPAASRDARPVAGIATLLFCIAGLFLVLFGWHRLKGTAMTTAQAEATGAQAPADSPAKDGGAWREEQKPIVKAAAKRALVEDRANFLLRQPNNRLTPEQARDVADKFVGNNAFVFFSSDTSASVDFGRAGKIEMTYQASTWVKR